MNTKTKLREIAQEIELAAEPAMVFSILHTPSAICLWWTASQAIVIAHRGGLWVATWGPNNDRPDYITAATIDVFEPPYRLVLNRFRYHSSSEPLPFQADFTVEFTLKPVKGGTLLRVLQSGFPMDAAADNYFAACRQGWRNTFENIKRFVAPRASPHPA